MRQRSPIAIKTNTPGIADSPSLTRALVEVLGMGFICIFGGFLSYVLFELWPCQYQ
ncbi:MAG: hypothetical protein AAF327_18500 [Cyanobacteria bacterium P01_A01_bin.37]